MSDAQAQMPLYQCHKQVWALKIEHVQETYGGGRGERTGAILHINDGNFSPIAVDAEYVNRCKPRDGGYYVVYQDGYKSYSPADAFESGYTLIGAK